jgi:hypothetical protein
MFDRIVWVLRCRTARLQAANTADLPEVLQAEDGLQDDKVWGCAGVVSKFIVMLMVSERFN